MRTQENSVSIALEVPVKAIPSPVERLTPGIRLSDLKTVMPTLCKGCKDKLEDLCVVKHVLQGSVYTNPILIKLRKQVAREAGVSEDMLLERCNLEARVNLRRVFAKRAMAMGFSLSAIARAIRRHHTTVINLVNPRKVRSPA